MKLGTDAIALGAWVATLGLSAPQYILDIGTGTGILALMMAQIFDCAYCDAIDIEEGAVADAQLNVGYSDWSRRISVSQSDFVVYSPERRYDLIITNPPYFASSGLSSPEATRRIARQESGLGMTLETLIERASTMLTFEGVICMICPIDRLGDIRRYATESLLYISHLTTLCSSPSTPIRYLIALRPLAGMRSYIPTHHTTLSIRTSSGAHSAEWHSLTSPFLLR